MSTSATIYGVGLGPGDPELMSVKAARLIAKACVIAHFRKPGRPGNARTMVDGLLAPGVIEEALEYPVTTEIALEDPAYNEALRAFYDECVQRLLLHISAGRDVTVLCEGDPFLYGSFMHLHSRINGHAPVVVVPGISGMSGCWTASGVPITFGDDVLTVVPATLDESALRERLQSIDALVVMKLGRNLPKVRRALQAVGLAERAIYVERGTMAGEKVLPLVEKIDDEAPYFSMLAIAGLGPGAAELITPEVTDALAQATDLIGYARYVARVPERAGLTRHGSDNREELDRASLALRLAAEGKRVVVVSSGDPGVFAMAAAVFEAVEAGEASWRDLDIRVLPGISAMFAAAARIGAPLGHDFCAINLSDNLKPWELVERRLRLAAQADFVIALYNPLSSARPWQLGRAFELLREELPESVPVIFARAVSDASEAIETVTLRDAVASRADMRTLVLIGSSRTRLIPRAGGKAFVYTPRSAGSSS